MSKARLCCLMLACVMTIAVLAAAPASGATPEDATATGERDAAVELSLSRAQVSTRLGESFDFTSTVTNMGSKPLTGLVAHLNVVGLSRDIYVDPEDWSEERTKRLPRLPPGRSADISWSMKAVTGGDAAIYVVVLPGKSPSAAPDGLAVSPALDVRIAERRTLNPGGILPLAIGVPALLGLLSLAVRVRRAR
jgi:uncharacterized membrane protein